MNNRINYELEDELINRWLVAQTTSNDFFEIADKEKLTLYLWTDPTADSLHIWHLVPLMLLSHFYKKWHKIIVLVWWATWMIGDPSFKNTERQLLSPETVKQNVAKLKSQFERILKTKWNDWIEFVNNYDWFKEMDVITFLREVGKYYSINNMLNKDFVKSRVDNENEWISFTEFAYSLLQWYDFLHLFENKWCNVQVWWNDQWWNIVSWIDLVRKKTGKVVYGLTCPLITKSDWTKFWKSEWWNIWLDEEKTSPYEFYQFWINQSDEDAERFIKLYSYLPKEEIDKLIEESKINKQDRILQKRLATEITNIIHSESTSRDMKNVTDILFWEKIEKLDSSTAKLLSGEIPSIEISRIEFNELNLSEILVKMDFAKSKWEARKLIAWNWLYINNSPIEEFDFSNINDEALLIRKWKKNYKILYLK